MEKKNCDGEDPAGYRIVQDSEANRWLQRDLYPVDPPKPQCLWLSKFKYKVILDELSQYYQSELAKKSRPWTAFPTPRGVA